MIPHASDPPPARGRGQGRARPVWLPTAALALCTLLTGCYRSHTVDRADAGPSTRDAALDARPADTGPSPRDARPDALRDTGIDAPRDAGTCEGMLDERTLHLCSFDPSGFVPAGEASTLSVWLAACGCPDDRRCAVAVDPAARTISLDTWSCPPTVACDECSNDLDCVLPPLEEGEWSLSVDDRYVGSIPVAPAEPVMIARPFCIGLPGDREPPMCTGDPLPATAIEVCHRELEDVGTFVAVDVRLECISACRSLGQCRARLDGRRVVIEVEERQCIDACTGCGEDHVARCTTPPLRAGEYTIVVDTGTGTASETPLTVRDVTSPGPTRCFTAPG